MRRMKYRQRFLALGLGLMMAFGSIPLNTLAAEENHAPYLTKEYESGTEKATIQVGKSYKIDLGEVFADPDGDALTYYLKIGDSDYWEAQRKCFYRSDETGKQNFTFKASDGSLSCTYDVELLVVDQTESSGVPVLYSAGTEVSRKLSSLIIHTGFSPKDENVLLKNAEDSYTSGLDFDPDTLEYQLEGTLYDTETQLGFRAKAQDENAVVTFKGNGVDKDITWQSGISRWVSFLTAGKNEFTVEVSSEGADTASTTYSFSLDVIPTLSSLTTEETSCWEEEFLASLTEYTVEVPANLKKLTFQAGTTSEGCTVTYNGRTSSSVDISGVDQVEVVVSKDGISNTYLIKLDKKPVYDLTIETTPSDAIVTVADSEGTKLTANADGSYTGMFETYEYTYTVSASGYMTVSGTVPEKGGTFSVALEKILGEQPQEVDAYWANFRNSEYNMAITDADTPQSEDAEDITPKWIKNFGSDWNASPSVPIIVDNTLVVMAGSTLYKLDLETGDILQRASMVSSPNYGYTPPTYAAGMIFCPLANGTIQAFNAKTLKSLWVYKDELGGQSLSPITYSDGYIYTGFWRQEEKDANFVCIYAADENVDQTNESKLAVWSYTRKGGFYWAGSVVVKDAVIVGTDDGAASGSSGTSRLYSFDKKNGDVISCLELSGMGDQRSSIAYDQENGKVYFTTKGGWLGSAKVNEKTGVLSNLKKVSLGMPSTSTPVVYKDRVYLGAGAGFDEGYLIAADAENLNILFKVRMKGYPQCSMLLSNAYEEQTGYVYLYSTYNSKPGGISVVKVKSACQTASDAELTELYEAQGYEEYCIASLICGEDGTLYYKNDSGNVFAIGVPTFENVKDLIDEIGTVTLDSEGKISAARKAYNALSKEDKAKVTNYAVLTAAEDKLEMLQNVYKVEQLIDAIGKVTLDSEDEIEEAREAYDDLTDEEQELVSNYKTLKKAEEKYEELLEEETELEGETKSLAGSTSQTTSVSWTTASSSSSTKTAAGSSSSLPTKSTLLTFQESLASVKAGISYEDALKQLKDYYALSEEDQLAFEGTDALEILREVVEEKGHTDADTGILVKGTPWNIRLVVEQEKNGELLECIREKLPDGEMMDMWDIYLEDVLTGERYQPEQAVEIWIPTELVSDYTVYDQLAILHYTDDDKLEFFNCDIEEEYIVFDTVEFSHYGVIGINEPDTAVSDAQTVSESEGIGGQGRSWMIWAALAAAGVVLFGILLFFWSRDNEDEEEEGGEEE